MSDTWRIVVVALAAGMIVEAVFLVAVMRQIGSLLLHVGPLRADRAAGPKLGTKIQIPGEADSGRPALVVFTSSGCSHCQALAPGLRRMYAVYGPEAPDRYQLDLVAVVTDESAPLRAGYARELGSFARTDLSVLMQEWDIPGTPFAVAVDAARRVRAAGVVNTPHQLDMLATQNLQIVGVEDGNASDASIEAMSVAGDGSRSTEVFQ